MLLLQTTIQRGRAHGVAGGLAMGAVDGGYALLATTAGLWLSLTLSNWTNWIELAGGVVLIVLAFDIWWRARSRPNPNGISRTKIGTQMQGGRVVFTGLKFAGATMLNPPTALYFLAIAPLVGNYAASSESLLQVAFGFSLGVWLASSSWQQAVVAGSYWLSHRITARWQYRIAAVGALLIVGFGMAAIWLGLN
jgi:threonine/homoserine/homoserine lactone efflux protein